MTRSASTPRIRALHLYYCLLLAVIAGRKDASVVVQGPYVRCRHPLFALSAPASLGLGLATRSVALALVTLGVSRVRGARAAVLAAPSGR